MKIIESSMDLLKSLYRRISSERTFSHFIDEVTYRDLLDITHKFLIQQMQMGNRACLNPRTPLTQQHECSKCMWTKMVVCVCVYGEGGTVGPGC